MKEAYIVALRAVGAYIALYMLTRWMGKREISQLTYFDYVVGITIGTLTGTAATDLSGDFWSFLPAVLVFALFQIVTSYLTLKSQAFRKLFAGTPVVLIEKGKILEHNLRKVRINAPELFSMLREKSVFRLADVELAILENNGKLSVERKMDKKKTK
jgi:uncharacterized membrane protein YcaP (DUF421 family)